MPKMVVRFFEDHDLRFHFGVALFLGLVFRMVTAYVAYGPMAMDDYVDGVYPAYQWASGVWPKFNPGRSYLLVWLLGLFAWFAKTIGLATDGVDQVRAMYLGLGAFSLFSLAGAYLYAKNSLNKISGVLFLYLISLYGVMPFLGTRAFGETVSMPWVLLGFAFLVNTPKVFIGFLFLGVASLFRFENGILFLSAAGFFLFQKKYHMVRTALIAGVIIVIVEALVDHLSGVRPFQTFIDHVWMNRHGGAEFGKSPWFSHILLLLGATLAPFSFLFFDKVLLILRRHALVFFSLLVFVLVHTFVSHKEERYLSPILPLLLLLLAAVWAEKKESFWVGKIYFPLFLGVNGLVIVMAAFSNTQSGNFSPVVDVQKKYSSGALVDTDTDLGRNFFTVNLFKKPNFVFLHSPKIGSEFIVKIFETFPKISVVAIFAREATLLDPIARFENPRLKCSAMTEKSSLTDRMVYYLNPKRNTRRGPTFVVTCENEKKPDSYPRGFAWKN